MMVTIMTPFFFAWLFQNRFSHSPVLHWTAMRNGEIYIFPKGVHDFNPYSESDLMSSLIF